MGAGDRAPAARRRRARPGPSDGARGRAGRLPGEPTGFQVDLVDSMPGAESHQRAPPPTNFRGASVPSMPVGRLPAEVLNGEDAYFGRPIDEVHGVGESLHEDSPRERTRRPRGEQTRTAADFRRTRPKPPERRRVTRRLVHGVPCSRYHCTGSLRSAPAPGGSQPAYSPDRGLPESSACKSSQAMSADWSSCSRRAVSSAQAASMSGLGVVCSRASS